MKSECIVLCLLAMGPALLSGCGGTSQVNGCTVTGISVGGPSPAIADHAAAPPGNSVQFLAFNTTTGNCPVPPATARQDVVWSVSDPANVSIGNTLNVDYGIATCKAAASGVTVTATGLIDKGATAKGTATLTCQ